MGPAYHTRRIRGWRVLNGYLVDTNVALFATAAPEQLSSNIRAALNRGPAFLSVIVYWEVMIKAMKGTLDVGEPRLWWQETIDSLALLPLAFAPSHVGEIRSLPPLHADPFDRALIAQAIAQDLTFLTLDKQIANYASQSFRVISPR